MKSVMHWTSDNLETMINNIANDVIEKMGWKYQ